MSSEHSYSGYCTFEYERMRIYWDQFFTHISYLLQILEGVFVEIYLCRINLEQFYIKIFANKSLTFCTVSVQ